MAIADLSFDLPGGAPAHLLVVDDDARLRAVLRRYLERNQFRVTEAADARDARTQLGLFAFDLIILDVMMPGESGLDLLADIRRTNHVPVLMLTAVAEPADRIEGLERGADDYLAKPFEPRELVLRIRNVLSRERAPPLAALSLGELHLDLAHGQLFCGDEPVRLTEGEAALLMALAARPGEPLTREALTAHGQFSGSERTVDVQITRLRKKIEKNPKFPRYLHTVRGIGYVLRPD